MNYPMNHPIHHPKCYPSTRARRGYTLLELVMASVSMTILMSASVALLSLVTSAMPMHLTSRGPDAAAVMATLEDRLSRATAIANISQRGIQFVVPDEDGDSADETYAYAWSGTPGAALTVNRNSQGAAVVLDDVASFRLSANAFSETTPTLLYESTSSESNWAWGNTTPIRVISTDLDDTAWMVRLAPVLPSGTVRWSIDRFTIDFANDTWDGDVKVSLFVLEAGETDPGTPVQETEFEADMLDAANEAIVDWLNVPEMTSTQRFAIVLESDDLGRNDTPPPVQLATDWSTTASGHFDDDDDGRYTSSGLLIPKVVFYGRATVAQSQPGATTTRYRSIDLSLQTVGGTAEQLTVPVRNLPEVP